MGRKKDNTKGEKSAIVQDILGHAEISMTMDTYSSTMQREAMDKLDELFEKWNK